MKRILSVALAVIWCCGIGWSQEKAEVNTVQPTIMVIPYVKEGQDIRTIIESDFNMRVAITKVKEAFDSRGFTTYDFTTKLKMALRDDALEIDQKTDLKKMVINLSGADIYVEVDTDVPHSTSGKLVRLNLTANDAFTGQALSNVIGESGRFYTDDIGKLTEKAVEDCIEKFLNTMNEKFGDIVENGRSIRLKIGFDENSEYDMDSEIGSDGDLVADLLEDWIEENSYKNYYHMQGISSSTMIVDDFRIPIKDENGRNFKARKISRKLRKYITDVLNMEVKPGVRSEGEIKFIIQ